MESDDCLTFDWCELVPGGVVVYYADGNEEIVHANKYLLDLLECRSMDELMELTGGSFRGFVHGSDVESTEDSIWGQVEERNGLDHIYYRVRTKSGRILTIDDYGKLVSREGMRPLFYVFLVEMDQRSAVDWLTGLPGMERFLYVAGFEEKAMRERGEEPALLMFDIMGMKTYNATNGRDAGDSLLKTLAAILRQHLGSELCCRQSGDSFYGLVSMGDVQSCVKEVFREFAKECGNVLPLMAGACELAEDDDLRLVADRAKFACETDRTTWESHLSWYTEEMRNESLMRSHVLATLDQAIKEGWIKPYYQGIVRSSTRNVCSAEALARWIDPTFGQLSPAKFIPALEEAGLLHRLDMHMVDCVVADLAAGLQSKDGSLVSAGYSEDVLAPIPVSLNMSLRELRDYDMAQEIAQRCDKAGIPHSLIRVEFTESVVSKEPELLKRQVQALHSYGFEAWMDDFGSGLSSLNALKEFDFDLIKLDMGLLSGGDKEKRRVILDGVVRAAKRMGVMTLAEGVETVELAVELAELGCDMLQGYHYFTPQPIERSDDAFDCRGWPVEPIAEKDYWDAIGAVSLTDIAIAPANDGNESSSSNLPAGIFERRSGIWRPLRGTPTLAELLESRGVRSRREDGWPTDTIELDVAYESAIARCEESGDWELVAGPMEYGSGYQFRVRKIASCDDAQAYLVASTPTTLGAALGTYGDVPMGYAVLRAVYGNDGQIVDAQIVYANKLYHTWGNFGDTVLIGANLSEISPEDEKDYWVSLCRRVLESGQSIRDVTFSNHTGHWLSYSVTPSPAEDHFIFAFAFADAEQEERLELIEAGIHDPLTGLLNRRGIDEEVERHVSEHPGEPFVFVLLDVDDFKTVNDLYGHDVGDEALRLVARTLRNVFPESAVVGRNGGDEALIALFDDEAKHVEEYLNKLLGSELRCELHGRSYPLSLSAGYAWCDGNDLKDAYTRADQALYSVKLSGKSSWNAWVPEAGETPQRSMLGFTSRDLAEGMPLAMLAHSIDGEILFANEGLARLLGYDSLANALDAVGRDLKGFVGSDDWARLHDSIHGVGNEEHEMLLRITKADGSSLRVVYRSRLICSKERGKVLYAYLVANHVKS
ncbi:MAG: EAL domain-containing protein [Atopobiaceae bacterium]|nr:EAL domain-containing protein [Atopobiaceae bacterium]